MDVPRTEFEALNKKWSSRFVAKSGYGRKTLPALFRHEAETPLS